ncbi:MAG: hypothetical protein J3Q66DRAFT_436695 [Benniella sp.]|nr:MAG: hypothetical protein J3Q66DRAFT_436695 [Benniella sp.]
MDYDSTSDEDRDYRNRQDRETANASERPAMPATHHISSEWEKLYSTVALGTMPTPEQSTLCRLSDRENFPEGLESTIRSCSHAKSCIASTVTRYIQAFENLRVKVDDLAAPEAIDDFITQTHKRKSRATHDTDTDTAIRQFEDMDMDLEETMPYAMGQLIAAKDMFTMAADYQARTVENIAKCYKIDVAVNKHRSGTNEQVALYYCRYGTEDAGLRDIIVQLRNSSFQRVSALHLSYWALACPVLFLNGDDGFHLGILRGEPGDQGNGAQPIRQDDPSNIPPLIRKRETKKSKCKVKFRTKINKTKKSIRT